MHAIVAMGSSSDEDEGTWYKVGKRGKARQKLAFQDENEGIDAGAMGNGNGTNTIEDSLHAPAAVAAKRAAHAEEDEQDEHKVDTRHGDKLIATANGNAEAKGDGRNRAALSAEEAGAAAETTTPENDTGSFAAPVADADAAAIVDSQERYRHRYQKYLVDELRRVIDELYLMLEVDYSLEDVRKAYQMLQTSAHDFSNLVRRGELQEIVSSADCGKDKPQSIAWEVRKTKASPKHIRLLEELSQNGSVSATADSGGAISRNNVSSTSPGTRTSHRRSGCDESNVDVNTMKDDERNTEKELEVGASSPAGMMTPENGTSPVRRRLIIDQVPVVTSSTTKTSMYTASSGDASVGEFFFDVRGSNSPSAEGTGNNPQPPPSVETQSLANSPSSSGSKALSIQAKLMSPERNRKRTPLETKQRAEMKQARAEAAREEHKEALATRLARVADERQAKQIQLADKREKLEKELETKHQRSKELRESHIQTIQQRASEENQKVSEVQFISQLAQETRKQSLRQRLEESEARRNEHLESIRQKQKGAEAAAEEAEARRRAAHARREQQKAEAEEKRRKLRKQKAEAQRFLDQAYKENMSRMSKSRKAREQATGHYFDASSTAHAVRERLQRATTRRREFVEQISSSACLKESKAKVSPREGGPSPSRKESGGESIIGGAGSTAVTIAATATSDTVDESGAGAVATAETHDEMQEEHSLKGQAWKNRTKKIRRRLAAMAFEPEVLPLADDTRSLVQFSIKKMKHSMNWIQRQMNNDKGSDGSVDTWMQRNIRRAELFMGEAKKAFDGGTEAEKHAARISGFLGALIEVLQNLPPSATLLTASIAKLVAQLLQLPVNAEYTLCTNVTMPLVQILCARLCGVNGAEGREATQSNRHATPEDPESVALEGLLMLFAEVLRAPCSSEQSLRMHENLLEYLVIFGVIHRLRDFVAFYERKADLGSAPIPGCIVAALYLLTSMATRKSLRSVPVHAQPPITSSQYTILSSFKHTVISGLVSILTETVLLAGPRTTAGVVLPTNFDVVSLKLFFFLNSIGRLNLETMQDMMGSPDMRVEAYHLVSFLLSYSTREWKLQPSRRGMYQSIINELLLFVGYFCLLRPTNQDVLHWGEQPTILQKLCDLPFDYYCKPRLISALIPTILIACYKHDDNLAVVREQLSEQHILDYVNKKTVASENPDDDVFALGNRFPTKLLSG